MNILLIFPPSTIYGADLTTPAVVPPLGLCYLGGYLEKHGYKNVTILDARSLSKGRVVREGNRALYGLKDDEIVEYIKKINPDVIGISCMYTAYSGDTHRLASTIKNMDKNIPVVVGGAHASTFPDLVLKDTNIDVVSHYEGEVTFLEVVRAIESNTGFAGVKGISYRENGVVIKNSVREFIEDLDTIPFPARHLVDMDLYLDNEPTTFGMRAPATTFITSRGCPQSCVFCTIKTVWDDMNFRSRSPKNVVDELEHLNKEYGIEEFYWMDDAAGTSKKRLTEICDEIIERKLDIKWTTPNGIAHWYLDEKVLDKMKTAGCYRVTFGMESGNLETRKYIGKPFSLEQATKMLAHANKIGLWTICTFIIGFPVEDEESIMDTIDYACSCGTDMAVFYLLCPHPGTDVYQDFQKDGLLDFEHILDPASFNSEQDFEKIGTQLGGSGASTNYLSPTQINDYVNLAYKRFFKNRLMNALNPVRTFRKIHNLEDLKYTIKVGKLGIESALQTIISKKFTSQKIAGERVAKKAEKDQEKFKNDIKLPLSPRLES